jgi:hypothetical protein
MLPPSDNECRFNMRPRASFGGASLIRPRLYHEPQRAPKRDRRSLELLPLEIPHPPIGAGAAQQHFVAAALDDPAPLEHQDLIGPL